MRAAIANQMRMKNQKKSAPLFVPQWPAERDLAGQRIEFVRTCGHTGSGRLLKILRIMIAGHCRSKCSFDALLLRAQRVIGVAKKIRIIFNHSTKAPYSGAWCMYNPLVNAWPALTRGYHVSKLPGRRDLTASVVS